MKIAVLTHPPARNYGGIMQALALSSALRELGHECEIVYGPVKKYPFFKRFKESVKEILGKGKERPYRYLLRFVREHLPVSEPWDGKRIPECDCFIVGSDQVWRPSYTHLPGAYFLDFLPEGASVKKIAYAASFGVADWEFTPEQTVKYGKLLRNFDLVSVREESGIALCERYLNCSALQMPDPVLLHDAGFYRSFIPDHKGHTAENVARKDLFIYFLDPTPSKSALADAFSDVSGLLRKDFLPKNKKGSHRPVEEFIRGIDQAGFVLTDSFHGMVFSMILGVPFAVIGNSKRGMTRFELAAKAGIPEVVLDEKAQLETVLKLYHSPAYCKKAEEFLCQERHRGRAFLQSALEK